MIKPPALVHEEERLSDLYSFEILDTATEQSFDDITSIASHICETPIALVSLVDRDRQWFKSCHGLLDVSETPRDVSFCGHAIAQSGIFEIPNALEDPRFSDNPIVVGEPYVIFYAGVPLRSSSGNNLGTICVVDHKARKLTQNQKKSLEALSRQVVDQMVLRKTNRDLVMRIEEIRRQAQQIENQKVQLIHSEKMATLGMLSGGVAHEINSPLSTILLSSRKIGKITGTGDTRVRSESEKIYSTTLRIADIVKGLKAVSREEQNDELQKVPIEQILNGTFAMCENSFKESGVQLSLEGEVAGSVHCRPGQISQVLLNLLGNAKSAVRELPNPWVKVVITCPSDTKTVISVIDCGAGVDPAIRDKMMEPFFTTKAVGKGTGLGLSISKSIIESNQGTLSYDDRSKNTKFDVTLLSENSEQRASA